MKYIKLIFLCLFFSSSFLYSQDPFLLDYTEKDAFTDAQNGLLYLQSGKKDYAFKCFLRAAEKGNILFVKEILGMLYTLEKDYKNGFYWFSEAVNDGSYDAKSFLGLYHLQGLGRTKNVQRALSYLKEAAREGSIPAAFHLGIIYATGHHGAVKPDFEASIALMKLAKEEGYPRAEDFYYRLLQVKMEKGVEKFHSAIENATKQPVRQQISSSDWLTGFLKDLEAALTIGIVAGVVIGGVSSFLDDDGGSETNSTSSGRNTTSVKFNVQNTIDISPVLRITDHPSHVICETNKYGLATIIITKSNKTAAGWYAFDFFLDNKNESGYSFSGKFYLDGSKSHYQITLIPHQNKFKEYKPY